MSPWAWRIRHDGGDPAGEDYCVVSESYPAYHDDRGTWLDITIVRWDA